MAAFSQRPFQAISLWISRPCKDLLEVIPFASQVIRKYKDFFCMIILNAVFGLQGMYTNTVDKKKTVNRMNQISNMEELFLPNFQTCDICSKKLERFNQGKREIPGSTATYKTKGMEKKIFFSSLQITAVREKKQPLFLHSLCIDCYTIYCMDCYTV